MNQSSPHPNLSDLTEPVSIGFGDRIEVRPSPHPNLFGHICATCNGTGRDPIQQGGLTLTCRQCQGAGYSSSTIPGFGDRPLSVVQEDLRIRVPILTTGVTREMIYTNLILPDGRMGSSISPSTPLQVMGSGVHLAEESQVNVVRFGPEETDSFFREFGRPWVKCFEITPEYRKQPPKFQRQVLDNLRKWCDEEEQRINAEDPEKTNNKIKFIC